MKITIEQIYEINPAVKQIIDNAKTIEDATCRDYTNYKQRLEKEVGFMCNYPELNNHIAYEVAINALADALKY